jgi:hypothetical protein
MLFAIACALALAAPACAAPRARVDIRQVADTALDGASALSIRIAANTSAATVPYYVPLDGPSYTARLSGSSATIGDGFGLATVVDEGADASFAGISKLLASYAGQDDVYNDAFAGGACMRSTAVCTLTRSTALIFSSAAKPKVSSSTVKALASAYGTDLVFSTSGGVSATGGVKSATVTFSKTVPVGPYVYRVDQAAHTATLWPVYRLYPDPQEVTKAPALSGARLELTPIPGLSLRRDALGKGRVCPRGRSHARRGRLHIRAGPLATLLARLDAAARGSPRRGEGHL